MKNIILCSDGTGNSGGKGHGTNVWRLFTSLDLNGHMWDPSLCEQVAYHDDGVGTRDNPVAKAIGGALGLGLKQNLRQLYLFLVDNYAPGDRIYIFGFSRGAYTARALAGLVALCGVVDRRKYGTTETESLANEAIAILRNSFVRGVRRDIAKLLSEADRETEIGRRAREFRSRHGVALPQSASHEIPIAFVGVWDTVDAYGFPSDLVADFVHYAVYPYRFPDTKLSPLVAAGRQAIAIDDERLTFHPVLWDEDGESPGRIEQVWFAGVHANVGGGYAKQGLAMISLDWMMAEAEAERNGVPGVRFIAEAREAVRRTANPYDKLYNARNGLALAYRYAPRDTGSLAARHGIAKPKIHESVFRRIRSGTESYAPLGVPRDFEIAWTAGSLPSSREIETVHGKVVCALAGMAPIHVPKRGTPLLHKPRRHVALRGAANFLLFPAAGLAIAAPLAAQAWQSGLSLPSWELSRDVWAWSVPAYAVICLLVWGLTALAKRRTQRLAHRFWRNLL